MPPRPVVTKITVEGSSRLNVRLENLGDTQLKAGHVFGRKVFKDGSVSELMSFAYSTLAPGETTKLFVNGIDNCKFMEIEGYRVSPAEAYPMNCTVNRGLFGWKVK
ncbi:MAG TPA: hypothetical protein VG839_06195 [Asticcacaulis sp.]|nr:hypothetical protein [Asticcacaulis sp.]